MGEEKPDHSGLPLDYRAGVPAGILAIIPEHLRRLPAPAPVGAPPQEEVDVARITAALLPPFAESQDRTPRGDDQRRDPVGMVASLSGNEERGFLRSFRGRKARAPDHGQQKPGTQQDTPPSVAVDAIRSSSPGKRRPLPVASREPACS